MIAQRSTLWLLSSCVIAVALAGCGNQQVQTSDAEMATTLAEQTLTAWAAGETIQQQRTKQPPTYVADDLWQSGATLESYEINGPGTVFGTNVRIDVTLRYKPKTGKPKQQQVFYLITTVPQQTIAREDR